jgi:hypothetical protein
MMPAPANTPEAMRDRLAEVRARTAAAATPTPAAPAAGARIITPRQLALLSDRGQLPNATAQFGVSRLEDLTFQQASALITALSTAPRTPARTAADVAR